MQKETFLFSQLFLYLKEMSDNNAASYITTTLVYLFLSRPAKVTEEKCFRPSNFPGREFTSL